MKAIVQRVRQASLSVDGQLVSEIQNGLVCYLGVGRGDSDKEMLWLARKVAGLRIFSDQDGKMNLSVKDCDYEILVVSQFTLFGDIRNGFRPSFIEAEAPAEAERMYERFCSELESAGIKKVAHGVFGADMQISQLNNGPVTIILDTAVRSL
ncbi:MAG: D-tyrosyl-tRNA(Tyr) deacylase [Erysipelotrichia bacterium]|nr:D-aminoacyl-tRNA deacylase [Candidatus Riflebacteria bacterium]NCB39757.1 D-tyrosyl-tRNA(Tyr) deacylase [Erysipelotrichia bacterium]